MSAAALVWGAALVPAASQAAQDMVLGRMVQARPGAPSVSSVGSPRAQYVLHCAGCHGVDGSGTRIGYVPDMRRLGDYLRLPGGRQFVISVPGVMGSGLDDRQVAEVANWVLSTLAADSVPEGHVPFDAAEVARARATPLVDVAAERRRLIEQARRLGLALE